MSSKKVSCLDETRFLNVSSTPMSLNLPLPEISNRLGGNGKLILVKRNRWGVYYEDSDTGKNVYLRDVDFVLYSKAVYSLDGKYYGYFKNIGLWIDGTIIRFPKPGVIEWRPINNAAEYERLTSRLFRGFIRPRNNWCIAWHDKENAPTADKADLALARCRAQLQKAPGVQLSGFVPCHLRYLSDGTPESQKDHLGLAMVDMYGGMRPLLYDGPAFATSYSYGKASLPGLFFVNENGDFIASHWCQREISKDGGIDLYTGRSLKHTVASWCLGAGTHHLVGTTNSFRHQGKRLRKLVPARIRAWVKPGPMVLTHKDQSADDAMPTLPIKGSMVKATNIRLSLTDVREHGGAVSYIVLMQALDSDKSEHAPRTLVMLSLITLLDLMKHCSLDAPYVQEHSKDPESIEEMVYTLRDVIKRTLNTHGLPAAFEEVIAISKFLETCSNGNELITKLVKATNSILTPKAVGA